MDRVLFSLLYVVVFALCIVLSNAALMVNAAAASPAERYWQRALPHTSMPGIIQELITADGSNAHTELIYRPLYYRTTTQDFPSDPHLFFLEKDLRPGSDMTPGLTFNRTISGAAFIPRTFADSLPFSSDKLADILDRLNVLPGSDAAKEVASTLHDCEAPAANGEHKLCATSLESMVDFVVAQLGTHDIRVAASTVHGNKGSARYAVAPSGVRPVRGGGAVVACHPQPFPRGLVYYCHRTRATKAYTVLLVGRDGSAVTAVAACHSDTAKWNPVFFKLLKVKPGEETICHFLPQDHLIWSAVH